MSRANDVLRDERSGCRLLAAVAGEARGFHRNRRGNISILVLRGDTGTRGFNLDDTSLHKFGSGIFRVDTVTHTIQAGTFTTQIEMYRNSGLIGPEINTFVVNLQALISNLSQKFKDVGVKVAVQPLRSVTRRFGF